MQSRTNAVKRIFALTVLFVLALTCFVCAQAETNRSGYISNFRTLDGDPVPGTDTRYKLSIRKGGRVTAVLTNMETGAAVTVHDAQYSAAQNILLVVPGANIERDHNYSLNVSLIYNSRTIGKALHTYSTVVPVARVDALSATASFEPLSGQSLSASFSLPSPASVTAVVKNAGGQQVAVLAYNTPCAAGANSLSWSGMIGESQLAPAGSYTLEVTCSNAAGTSPKASASFRVTGDTSSVLSGRVQGTIQSILLPGQPEDGAKPTFTIRATEAGRYTLKLKNVTTGKSVKLTGYLSAGVNLLTIDQPSSGGSEYLLQMIEQVSGRTVGKAELRYRAHIDPPSISVSAPATLKAGYGAVLPITYTTGTSGYTTLLIANPSHTNVFASLDLGYQSKGTHTAYWNGLASDGSVLPNGTYHIVGVCGNVVGQSYSKRLPLQYEGAIAAGAAKTQGAITVFGAENPEPVERTPVRMRVHVTSAGTLKVALRDTASNSKAVVVYNAKVSAGMNTITIPADYFAATTYEIQATLNVNRRVVGRATAFVKPYIIDPEVVNFVCNDGTGSKWGPAYEFSFDTVSTGFLCVVVQDNSTGSFVRTLKPGIYSSAGHYSYTWDGRDNNGKTVPDGSYRIVAYYDDSYGNRSNFAAQNIDFKKEQLPEGVYGYAVVGQGTHKTPIHIYDAPDGKTFAVAYGISSTFEVLEDLGDWVYVETTGTRGDPVKGYVKSKMLQKVAITSPYRIAVNISRKGPNAQTMYVYKDEQLIDTFKVSTGRVEGTTPTGTFCLLNRKPYFKVLGGGGICYDALRVVGGVCIHRIPMISGSYRSTEPLLGSPASAGCIRVPISKSTWLYETMPDTTIIQTYRSTK